jgi:predicted nuclease of predicted toxin-antitoxin system
VKLLLDEHYANKIAVQLRAAGYEAVTVSERRLNGTDDEPLLALASSENSALLTNNARDLLPIVARWTTSGQDHCGLLLTSDSSMPRGKDAIGLHFRTLSELMQANPGARALENQVRWLP